MLRGTELEPAARAAYEEHTGLVMQPLVLEAGRYSASLDGMTLEGDLVLEIKCPLRGTRSDLWQDVAAGAVPEHYVIQVQHQLMVSGAQTANLWVYDGKAFIQAVFLKEMVHLAEESLKRSSDRLKDTEAKFKAGSVTKIELLRIRAENSESETFFSETRDRYKAGTDQLKLLLNLPIKEEIEISGSLKIHPDELKRVFSLNLSTFTPVFWKAQAAGIQAKQAGKLSEMEKSDMLPAVAVGMKADEANPYLLQDKFGTIYTGFIQASMPVWDWGKNKKKYLISQEQKIKAESIAEDVRNQLEAYYSILTDRIQSIKKGINSREKNLDRSKAARDAAETARKNGAATYNDWADTELLHFRLEVDYLKNLSDLYISIADLERFIEEPTDIFSGFETDSQRKNR
jgi:outer membrane protein TolC